MRFRERLARRLMGSPPSDAPQLRWPAMMPTVNPLHEEGAQDGLRSAAMLMTDDDCFGYLLLTVHRVSAQNAHGQIRIAGHLQPQWWPAVAETLEQVITTAKT